MALCQCVDTSSGLIIEYNDLAREPCRDDWRSRECRWECQMSLLSELKNYPPATVLGMGFSFLWTKLFFRGADLIRKPLYFRGKKRNFHYGSGFRTGRGVASSSLAMARFILGTIAILAIMCTSSLHQALRLGMTVSLPPRFSYPTRATDPMAKGEARPRHLPKRGLSFPIP